MPPLSERRYAEVYIQDAVVRCRHVVAPSRRAEVMREAYHRAYNYYYRRDLPRAWWCAWKRWTLGLTHPSLWRRLAVATARLVWSRLQAGLEPRAVTGA